MNAAAARRQKPVNRTAIAALILSVLGVTAIIGVVCGHMAKATIRRTKERGEVLATAALWVGYLYLAAALLCLIAYLYIVNQA
ncbi:protein of unknown function [Williamsia sterculiae]|uniref:DUF4190 domain-containing protein n=2 Tax=Williamsia sterculiae TaxID=1344003 RepID=A0A1N7FF78_9NOCA|nr:protein of unknown function [Williamsia sterculiae]